MKSETHYSLYVYNITAHEFTNAIETVEKFSGAYIAKMEPPGEGYAITIYGPIEELDEIKAELGLGERKIKKQSENPISS